MIHRDFPGGPEELQEYVMEVCEGIKDHWSATRATRRDTRWEYTYHQRLFGYEAPTLAPIDQIEQLCRQLAETPYTRRAQAVTWKVWEDNDCYDPACLQSIWCRIIRQDGAPRLSMNVRFRSNDAYKAAFMNIFALVQLQAKIAARVGELSGMPVQIGPLLPHGRQLPHLRLEPGRVPRAVPGSDRPQRSFAERTLRYEDVREMMEEARPAILEKARNMGRRPAAGGLTGPAEKLLGRGRVSGIIRPMTPQDVLRTVTEAEIGREIIRLVPHWYDADCGPERMACRWGTIPATFATTANSLPISAPSGQGLRPDQGTAAGTLHQFSQSHRRFLGELRDRLAGMHSATTDWPRLVKYLETVARRTYENQPVSLNLIIRAGAGVGDISAARLQKFFDQLASSPFSYLAVDGDLRLMHYGEVEWPQGNQAACGKFYPEFLHPIHSIMDDRTSPPTSRPRAT